MVFYLKMKGDYNRYLLEFKLDIEHKEAVAITLLCIYSSDLLLGFLHICDCEEDEDNCVQFFH